MCSLTQNKQEFLINSLMNLGYQLETIKRAFKYISDCSETERIIGVRKMGPNLLKESTKTYSIYTCILKFSVEEMISNWNSSSYGRLSLKNIEMYRMVCKMFLQKADNLINENLSINTLCNKQGLTNSPPK